MEKPEYSQEFTIDRIEGDQAVLRNQAGDEWLWPKTELPADAVGGKIVYLKMITNPAKSVDTQKMAKDILNEILNKDEE
jgi:hypothetical protein